MWQNQKYQNIEIKLCHVQKQTSLINSFIPEKTTEVTRSGVTQDCIIMLGVSYTVNTYY